MPRATLADLPAGARLERPAATPGVHPGNEVPPGMPQSGEEVCERCTGRGWLDAGACPDCAGSGLVMMSVGDV